MNTYPAGEELTATEVVEKLLRVAYEKAASDIHIDISEMAIVVRMRIDGQLEPFPSLPISLHSSLIARFKILASLRIDEHGKPQDGRFKFNIGNEVLFDIRISIVPTFFGENAVLRLLAARESPTLEALGLLSTQEKLLSAAISRSQGFILVTGPTGCGKTTTTYALLNMIARRPLSLVTIEDPVEYSIPEAVQIQVNPQTGLTFAEGLRGILRQDPDVIMVGEIRDSETAALGINAALTGHLVLSTLHSNNALGVLPRLIDLCIDPYLISSCLSMVIAQRLVRRICPNCRTEKELSRHESLWLEEALGTALPNVVSYGAGCELCGGKGYRGRVGLFDVVTTSSELFRHACGGLGNSDIDEDIPPPLFADGVEKVARGETSVEELLSLSYAESL